MAGRDGREAGLFVLFQSAFCFFFPGLGDSFQRFFVRGLWIGSREAV
jgi:hypothetical protein